MTPSTPEEALLRAREARVSRALTEGEAMTWTKTAAGWRVTTASGGTYECRAGTCSCPDFLYRSHRSGGCKHLVALALFLLKKGMI